MTFSVVHNEPNRIFYESQPGKMNREGRRVFKKSAASFEQMVPAFKELLSIEQRKSAPCLYVPTRIYV